MKTKQDISYHVAPYGSIAVIPAGTTDVPARNLPPDPGGLYWAKGWRGMTAEERAWQRSEGFLLTLAEVKGE